RAVQLLELVEFAAVDHAGDDLAHVVRPADIGRDYPVDLLGGACRFARRLYRERYLLLIIEIADDAPGDAEGVAVVKRVMVGDAGDPAVHIGAAQILGADHLAGRRLYQRWAAEKDRALALDDDAFVAHCRDIGAAGGARPHHDRDLRHP